MNEQISSLASRIDVLPTPHPSEDMPEDSLSYQDRGSHRRLPSASHMPISRASTAEITPETIASTVEVFSGEVKMTRLKDLLVHAKGSKSAPLNKLLSLGSGTSADHMATRDGLPTRTNPFNKFAKPVVLKDLTSPRPASSPSQMRPQHSVSALSKNTTPFQSTQALPATISQTQGPTAVHPSSTDADTFAPISRPATGAESLRRSGGLTSSRHHSKAVPINRDRQAVVQENGFSFGPPPTVSSTLKLPENFVSLTWKKP